MRWPWQRAEQRSDAAAPAAPPRASIPDAAPPVPPAGWAFLPPLQRQVSDAPPVVMRPAFVSSLPTRTVPASLGTMGHLVDDHAPAGTVAVDGGALGAPVQRAIASELTLRPGRVEATRTVARSAPVVQRSTDVAGALPLEEPAPEEAAPADPADEGAPAEAALEESPPDEPPVEEHARSTDVEAAHRVEPDAPAARGSRGLIGEGLPVTVSRLGEEPAQPAAAFAPDVASPGLQTPKRVGLGAPLPTTPLQRSATEAERGAAAHRVSSGWAAPVVQWSAVGRQSVAAASGSGAPEDGQPLDESETPSVESVESPSAEAAESASEPVPEPAAAAEPVAPLLGETSMPVATTPDVDGFRDGAARLLNPQPEIASAPLAKPSPIAVQREIESAGPLEHDTPAGGTQTHTHAAPTEAAADVGGFRDGAARLLNPRSDAATAVQRSLALVADRRIVPSLTAPTGGPTPAMQRGRVVVARVIAPQPPAPPAPPADEATSVRPSTMAMPPRAQGTTTGAASASASPTTARAGSASGGATADDSWASDTPVVAASVARLTTAPIVTLGRPGGQRPVGAGASPREPMPVAAVAAPAAAAAAAVQRSIELGPAGSATRPSAGADAATTWTPSTMTTTAAPSDAGGTADVVVQSAPAPTSTTAAPAPPGAAPENVEQLVRKLYGPLVRRIKAELLLDRERRGIRIDGI